MLVGVEMSVIAGWVSLWCRTGGPRGASTAARLEGRKALFGRWALTTFQALVRAQKLRVEVEGLEGPPDSARQHLLVFRHVSVLDVLLPQVVFQEHCEAGVGQVVDRELLSDPALNVVASGVGNVLVDRKRTSTTETVNLVASAVANLLPGQAFAVFPEGARFSPARRNQVRRHLQRHGEAERAEEAEALRHLLPVGSRGTRALMDRRGDAEIWVCGHVGFESVFGVRELFRGGLWNQTVRIRVQRYAPDDIPADPDRGVAWMRERWRELDAWVNATKLRALADGAREVSP
jgi:1-acyl-sn-glycerol-3-phosphate acyltransferase